MDTDAVMREAMLGHLDSKDSEMVSKNGTMITRDILYLRMQTLQRHIATATTDSIEKSQYIVQQTLEHLSSPTASQHVPHETIRAVYEFFQEIAVELSQTPINKAILMQLTGAVLLLVDPC